MQTPAAQVPAYAQSASLAQGGGRAALPAAAAAAAQRASIIPLLTRAHLARTPFASRGFGLHDNFIISFSGFPRDYVAGLSWQQRGAIGFPHAEHPFWSEDTRAYVTERYGGSWEARL